MPKGEVLANISNALVRLHKEYYGKGPTRAKTFVVDDAVVCILRTGGKVARRRIHIGQAL